MSGKLQHWESYRYYGGDYWGHPEWDAVHKKEMQFENASVTPDAVHNDPLNFFRDSYIIKHAISSIKKMNNLVGGKTPWFQGIGLKGTHMPYHMPKMFHDRWKNYEFEIPDEALSYPLDAPLLAHVKKTEQTVITFMANNGTLKSSDREQYQSSTNGRTGRTISRRGFSELYRGYLACLSYVDFMLGLLFDELDRQDLWSNTAVVLTSDHGMHVGEKGVWGKWTLFEESTHVPLIVVTPLYPNQTQEESSESRWKSALRGVRSFELVELVDIFPTLVDISGTVDEFMRPCPILAPLVTTSSNTSTFGSQPIFAVPRGGPRLAVLGEGPVTNVEGHIFRHVYCDPLDGSSLSPFLFSEPVSTLSTESRENSKSLVHKRNGFTLTQKMTCKLPTVYRDSSSIDKLHDDLDPNTPNWIDFCPNKKIPRNPPFGAMGYAMRTRLWKYVAWLRFDTHSFLPSLNREPLAEQLYDMTILNKSSPHSITRLRGAIGELHNLAYSTNVFHMRVRERLRIKLYDYLFLNASFAHLYHRRLEERIKNSNVIMGRLSGAPRDYYHKHFYAT